MALRALRTVWESLLQKSSQSSDPRQLQRELDIHRLYLLTSFNAAGPGADEVVAGNLERRAAELGFEGQEKEVHSNVHRQLLHLLRCLQDVLEPGAQPTQCEASGSVGGGEGGASGKQPLGGAAPIRGGRKRPSGLSFAVGSSGRVSDALPEPASARESGAPTSGLSMAEVGALLGERVGYAVEARPSEVAHPKAGEGLFVRGRAPLGSVLALYPGVVYLPSHFKFMPGYPSVARSNPYLISCFDGAIIDGRPWGRGGESRDWWSGLDPADLEWFYSREDGSGGSAGTGAGWREALGGGQVAGAELLACTAQLVERRNPLALAHFANHPGPGATPNVMLCTYDFPLTAPTRALRPYIPNVTLGGGGGPSLRRQGVFWVRDNPEDTELGGLQGGRGEAFLRSLLLVTTRDVCDEEALLNYRLSTPLGRPSWYTPVNAEEDRRRWAMS